MCDQSGRLVELLVLSGVKPRLLVVEVVSGDVKLLTDEDEGQQRTKMWLNKMQLRNLLELVSPVIAEMVNGGAVVGREPRVVVGRGLRAALVLRKQCLSMAGVIHGGKSLSLLEDKVVMSVGRVSDDQEIKREEVRESEAVSKYFA